jgi:breast cancer 2 susceptibility protein
MGMSVSTLHSIANDDSMTYSVSFRDVVGLSQISPVAAIYYSFHTATATPLFLTSSLSPAVLLGSAAALNQLLDHGCTLATKPWVDNHWCLILWKLAGMVALDPERESSPTQKRWCWSEVMRQLCYRCVASNMLSRGT